MRKIPVMACLGLTIVTSGCLLATAAPAVADPDPNVYGASHALVEAYERRINEAMDSGYIFASAGPFTLVVAP